MSVGVTWGGGGDGKAGATKAMHMGNKKKRVTTRAKQGRVRPNAGVLGHPIRGRSQLERGGASLHEGVIGGFGEKLNGART